MDGSELCLGQIFVMMTGMLVTFIISREVTRYAKREHKKENGFHEGTTGVQVYLAGCAGVKKRGLYIASFFPDVIPNSRACARERNLLFAPETGTDDISKRMRGMTMLT